MAGWRNKPNWWLYHFDKLVACWYCSTKREAKALAKCYVDGAKETNKLKKVGYRVFKKDFNLVPTAKGANDA